MAFSAIPCSAMSASTSQLRDKVSGFVAQEIPSWSQILQSLTGRKLEESDGVTGFFLNEAPGLIPHLGAL